MSFKTKRILYQIDPDKSKFDLTGMNEEYYKTYYSFENTMERSLEPNIDYIDFDSLQNDTIYTKFYTNSEYHSYTGKYLQMIPRVNKEEFYVGKYPFSSSYNLLNSGDAHDYIFCTTKINNSSKGIITMNSDYVILDWHNKMTRDNTYRDVPIYNSTVSLSFFNALQDAYQCKFINFSNPSSTKFTVMVPYFGSVDLDNIIFNMGTHFYLTCSRSDFYNLFENVWPLYGLTIYYKNKRFYCSLNRVCKNSQETIKEAMISDMSGKDETGGTFHTIEIELSKITTSSDLLVKYDDETVLEIPNVVFSKEQLYSVTDRDIGAHFPAYHERAHYLTPTYSSEYPYRYISHLLYQKDSNGNQILASDELDDEGIFEFSKYVIPFFEWGTAPINALFSNSELGVQLSNITDDFTYNNIAFNRSMNFNIIDQNSQATNSVKYIKNSLNSYNNYSLEFNNNNNYNSELTFGYIEVYDSIDDEYIKIPKSVWKDYNNKLFSKLNSKIPKSITIDGITVANSKNLTRIATITDIYEGSTKLFKNSDTTYVCCIITVSCPNFICKEGSILLLNFDILDNISLVKKYCEPTYYNNNIGYNYISGIVNKYTHVLNINNKKYLLSFTGNDICIHQQFNFIGRMLYCVFREGENYDYFKVINPSSEPIGSIKDFGIYGKSYSYIYNGNFYIQCDGRSLPNYFDSGFPSSIATFDISILYPGLAYFFKSKTNSLHSFGGDETDNTTFTLPTIKSDCGDESTYKYIRV